MSTTSPHFAKSVFFSCIDDRLVNTDSQFINKLGGAFHPAVAGGGLAFLTDGDREIALKQVAAAYKINRINNVYLESHTDCGAYALSGAVFHSATAELARLYSDLDQAATFVVEALKTAGAKDGEVQIHLRVVDPSGKLQPRPQHAPA